MNIIQLFIGTDRLDMFKDENVSITQSIKNVRDISKVFTAFSKQFTVPASKANNKVFEHYYNYDIVNGFDARIRTSAKIELNSLPFLEGKLKLDGVQMRDNKPYAYKVTFFGSVIEMKDVLGEDKLPSLNDLSDSNHLNIDFPYSSEKIEDHLLTLHATDSNNNLQTGISLPLITHSQRLYYDSANESEYSGNLYWGTKAHGLKRNQLKYAVRLDRIIDAIEGKYPEIAFASTSFFKDNVTYPDIHEIYMWCHRKNGYIDVPAGNENRVFLQQTYGQTYFNVDVVGDVVMESNAGTNDTLHFVASAATTSRGTYDLIIKKNGTVIKYYEKVSGTVTPNFSTGSWSAGDEYAAFIRTYDENLTFTGMSWQFKQGTTTVQTANVPSGYLNYTASFRFNIAKNLPEQKIIDFLSSLFKMFNLTAYVNDSGEIEVLPLDDYYVNDVEHDISKYIDISKSTVDVALPFKQIFFKYKDTKTIIANQHFQELSDVEWGGIEYTDVNNIYGDIYKVEPDFHHAKYERIKDLASASNDTGIQWGYFVNDSENAFLGKPLLMYINNISPSVDMSFMANDNRVQIGSSQSINMPCNTQDIDDASSRNLHFNTERSEYTNTNASNTLFSRFYQAYIENIFNSNNRMLKVSAVLPLGKILEIQLSHIIVINNRKYRINTMKTSLMDGKTDFELLNYYD